MIKLLWAKFFKINNLKWNLTILTKKKTHKKSFKICLEVDDKSIVISYKNIVIFTVVIVFKFSIKKVCPTSKFVYKSKNIVMRKINK